MPVLSDFLIMNENTGFLWLGGEIESEEAGRADFHMQKSGQVDLVAESDEEAMDLAKRLLEFMPQSCWEEPPRVDCTDDPDRREEALLDVMPDNVKFTYDIHEVIDLIVDDGEFFRIKEDFAPNLAVGFARFDGMPVGIVANNGVLFSESALKGAHFVELGEGVLLDVLPVADELGGRQGQQSYAILAASMATSRGAEVHLKQDVGR